MKIAREHICESIQENIRPAWHLRPGPLRNNNASKPGMKGAGVFFAFHASCHAITNTVLIAAHERSTALNALNDIWFLWVEAGRGAGRIVGGTL